LFGIIHYTFCYPLNGFKSVFNYPIGHG
jgi:hypothetical protein